MFRIVLQIIALILIVIGAGAFAQDRTPPQNREQVMLSYAPLVEKVAPAVVNIYTQRVVTRRVSPFANDPFFEQFFGGNFGFGGLRRQQLENSLGSGLIIDKDGVVITNAHVVKGAQEVSVVLNDGREFDAEVSLTDDGSDLAILRVDTKDQKLPYATLKPSETLAVGDIVIAIGNPFGVGQTVTSGIVSALSRSSLNINDFNFFIQTDAAINPGNSGGPLVSMDGGVVGINTAIFSRDGGSLGIGFAIPSEMVATVVTAEKQGLTSAAIARPWLGITTQNVSADIAESLGLNRPSGVLVTDLHNASPAKKAGLQVSDVITAINGREIRDSSEMKFRLATIPIGDTTTLAVLRKGKRETFLVTAMAPPDDPPRNETILEGAHIFNGAKVANINPALSVELGLESQNGVVIVDIPRTGRAIRVARPGDVVVSINDDDIDDVKDLERELRQASRQGVLNLVLQTGDQRRQIVLR